MPPWYVSYVAQMQDSESKLWEEAELERPSPSCLARQWHEQQVPRLSRRPLRWAKPERCWRDCRMPCASAPNPSLQRKYGRVDKWQMIRVDHLCMLMLLTMTYKQLTWRVKHDDALQKCFQLSLQVAEVDATSLLQSHQRLHAPAHIDSSLQRLLLTNGTWQRL